MIPRDVAGAASHHHDLIIIGGGIHGAAVALRASEAGLRPLLLEARDFGGGTSWNTMHILHGGLRYLQTGDVPRFLRSVADRRWFMLSFPRLVRPMRCLMPLYREGLKRTKVLRAALLANDILSAGRNRGVAENLHLPRGQLLDRAATLQSFRLARRDGLEGAAVWYDGYMPSPERILIDMLHRACAFGCRVANYACVEHLLIEAGRVSGVEIRDEIGGAIHQASAPIVISCMGVGAKRLFAGQEAIAAKMSPPSLAFNVLLDIEPPADCAVAVSSPGSRSPVYFLLPHGSRTLAGTALFPRAVDTKEAIVSEEEVAEFVNNVRMAVPAMCVRPEDVVRVFAGLLPARSPGGTTLATRAKSCDHAAWGGPIGLYSAIGTKFTTARSVSTTVIKEVFPDLSLDASSNPASAQSEQAGDLLLDYEAFMRADYLEASSLVQRIAGEESVLYLDDIVMRRTNWGATAPHAELLHARVASCLTGTAGGLKFSSYYGSGSGEVHA